MIVGMIIAAVGVGLPAFAGGVGEMHLVEYARINAIDMFVQVGTACVYPRHTPVPFKEDHIWNGYPAEATAPYGIAKKASMVMLDGYRRQYGLNSAFVLPVNLYGPGDNFDPASSHVIPALVRKCVEAIGRRHALLGEKFLRKMIFFPM